MAYVTSRARGVSAILACLLVTACGGSGGPIPMEGIGPSDRSLAIPLAPVAAAPESMTYQAPPEPAQTAQRGIDYLDTPNLASARVSNDPNPAEHTLQAQQVALASATGEVDMDSQFGFNKPAGRSVSDSAASDIVEGDVDQPVVDGIGTDQLTQVPTVGQAPVANAPQPQPVRDQQVAYVPRFGNAMSVPESHGGMPDQEKSCRQELARMGVRFTDLPRIQDGSQCGIDYPISLDSISGIKIMPAAKLNCSMALTFAKWTKSDLVPTARLRYFSGVKAIRQMSSYSCRRMNSKSNNPWSEHAHGNAIDIGTIILNNGNEIDVRKPGFFSFRQKGLLNTVRADSCKYFNTVLGPGDPYHGDHFHFDLRSRKSGRRYCSLD
jgi:hypothetical protein